MGVTHHRALRSPDFPPSHVPRPGPLGRSPDTKARAKAPRRSSRPPRTSAFDDTGRSRSEQPAGREACREDPIHSRYRLAITSSRKMTSELAKVNVHRTEFFHGSASSNLRISRAAPRKAWVAFQVLVTSRQLLESTSSQDWRISSVSAFDGWIAICRPADQGRSWRSDSRRLDSMVRAASTGRAGRASRAPGPAPGLSHLPRT